MEDVTSKKNIQLFKPTYRVEECLKEIRECLEIGWTGLGFKTNKFEELWSQYTGLQNCHFLNSATAGLHLAVEILKEECEWQNNDEIITTPTTFVSTNHAILYSNLKPIFADIDEYLCLDPKSVKEKITPKTKAILFVGIGGNTGQYEEIVKICKENNLKLILDAAHMAGTKINGTTPGAEADAVIYSFQAVKNLPTGDSGMICFKEKHLDEIARKKAWLGINKDTYSRTNSNSAYKWKYDVEYTGYKSHGNSIMASIAMVQLNYLEQDNEYRRQLASWYDNELKSCEKIKLVKMAPDCKSSRHLYQILVKDRDELLLKLNEHGIFPGVHYMDNTEYKMYSYAKNSCPNAMKVSASTISLPMHLQLTHSDVQYVAEMVKKHAM